MFENIRYVPFLKTADAEIRAIKNLDSGCKAHVLPLFFLTKSRLYSNRSLEKHPGEVSGSIYKRLEQINTEWGNEHSYILDITSSDIPSDEDSVVTKPDMDDIDLRQLEWIEEIKRLFSSENGYAAWVDLVKHTQNKNKNIIPMLQFNGDTEPLDFSQFHLQISKLDESVSYFALKISRDNEATLDETTEIMLDAFRDSGLDLSKLIIVFDLQYITKRESMQLTDELRQSIDQCRSQGVGKIIVGGSSFPKSISDDMVEGDKAGVCRGELTSTLCQLYEDINDKSLSDYMVFGGYSYVNPQKIVSSARGWVPRIDIPLRNRLIFFRKKAKREKKDGSSKVVLGGYADAYENIAKAIVRATILFRVPDCWGKSMIQEAADRGTGKFSTAGASPSFWISVKINIHITTMACLENT